MGAYKEWSTDACYKVNEPWKYYAKWKKPVTKWHRFYIKYPAQTIEISGWGVGSVEVSWTLQPEERDLNSQPDGTWRKKGSFLRIRCSKIDCGDGSAYLSMH